MLKIWTPVILLLIISSLLVYKFFVEPPPPKQISIATGSTTGAYFHFGEQYKDALAKDGIQLDVHKTAGSLENLSKLINEEVDMAFIQGGTSLTRDPNLRCLGSVYYEPIWFFYRSITPKDRLIHFRGKRIQAVELRLDVAGAGVRRSI